MSEDNHSLTQSSSFLRGVYRAAVIPGIISFFSSNLAILADGILVGQYVGVDGLASVSLSTPVIMLISLVGGFLSCGAETICARELGRSQQEKAQRIYAIQTAASFAFSLVMITVGLFFSTPIATLLCQGDQTLIPLVREYSEVFLLGAPAIVMTFPPFWFLPMDGKNRSVTAMMLIMGIGNILLDFLFLQVLSMGVRGAALASVLSAGIAALFGMILLHRGRHTFRLRLAWPNWKEWREISAAGSPEANNYLFQALRSFAVNTILLRMSGNAGNIAVAQYSVVSSMSAICEGVTVGVPQSGSAILGIYCGERDNQSVRILLTQQLKTGLIGCAVLALLFGFGAPLISQVYKVSGLNFPLIMLGVSLFPVLIVNIATNFYRVNGYEWLSNLLIAMRNLGFCVPSLLGLIAIGASPWPFQVAEAVLTLLLWIVLTGVIQRREKKKPLSRWMLMDTSMEDGGNCINFSCPADSKAICDASERISAFCAENQMAPRQVMRVSLALEEMMTLIAQFNPDTSMSFEVRVFSVQGVIGIRIRYGGIDFNPLSEAYQDDERFMGIQMVRGLVVDTVYQSTFGANSVLILIERSDASPFQPMPGEQAAGKRYAESE